MELNEQLMKQLSSSYSKVCEAENWVSTGSGSSWFAKHDCRNNSTHFVLWQTIPLECSGLLWISAFCEQHSRDKRLGGFARRIPSGVE